eukprot:g16.t1
MVRETTDDRQTDSIRTVKFDMVFLFTDRGSQLAAAVSIGTVFALKIRSTYGRKCCSVSSARSKAIVDEESRKLEKPFVTKEEATRLCFKKFGIESERIKSLESYDDANFFVEGKRADGKRGRFVLKIHNGVESDNASFLRGSNAMLLHLSHVQGIAAPVPVSALSDDNTGDAYVAWASLRRKPTDSGAQKRGRRRFAIRLLRFVDGKMMNEMSTVTPESLRRCGVFLGRLRTELDRFTSSAKKCDTDGFVRDHLWDIRQTSNLRAFVSAVDDVELRALVDGVVKEFESTALARDMKLPRAVLHNDYNDANVIVDASDEVKGVIDFGDSVMSWRVNDVAIAVAYLLVMLYRVEKPVHVSGFRTRSSDASKDVRHVLCAEAVSYFMKGLDSEYKLSEEERALVPVLAACRLAISGTMGLYSFSLDPTNEYLKEHARPAWDALRMLRAERDLFETALSHKEGFGLNVGTETRVRIDTSGSVTITGGLKEFTLGDSSDDDEDEEELAEKKTDRPCPTTLHKPEYLSIPQMRSIVDLFEKWDTDDDGYIFVREFRARLAESDVGSIQCDAFLVLMGYDDTDASGSTRIDLPSVLAFFDEWHGSGRAYKNFDADQMLEQLIKECNDIHDKKYGLGGRLSPPMMDTPDETVNLF